VATWITWHRRRTGQLAFADGGIVVTEPNVAPEEGQDIAR
jgi:hypothetical protein